MKQIKVRDILPYLKYGDIYLEMFIRADEDWICAEIGYIKERGVINSQIYNEYLNHEIGEISFNTSEEFVIKLKYRKDAIIVRKFMAN